MKAKIYTTAKETDERLSFSGERGFEFKNTDRTVRDILRWCLSREKEVSSAPQDNWKEE